MFIYVYDWAGDGSDYDIHASAINGDGSGYLKGPFYIATTTGQETSADISFITAPIPSIAYYAPSKLLTTYIRSDFTISEGVMAATIEGNCDYEYPEYTSVGGSQHFLVDSPSLGFGSGVFAPSISGGGGTDFFISYDDVASGTVWRYDVLGALLSVDLLNFLPLILR